MNLTTVGIIMFLSSMLNNQPIQPTQTASAVTSRSDVVTVQLPRDQKNPGKQLSTEAYVRTYFKDLPIMTEIARCESEFRQVDKYGELVHGRVNPNDIGVMQINVMYHFDRALKLGYDIRTLEGNVAYARALYQEQGARPWLASAACWANTPNPEVASKLPLTRNTKNRLRAVFVIRIPVRLFSFRKSAVNLYKSKITLFSHCFDLGEISFQLAVFFLIVFYTSL
ncbi:hypothetical protein KW783_04200 [Candidatus Parcubacteria bacterium]|nr:hypothetical protein [Candidatus Parcubacteria bacterium]